MSHELTAFLSVFNLFSTQWIMALLSEGCKLDNFEPHNSLKLSFTGFGDSHMRRMYICTYAWATGMYAWLVSCIHGHVCTFPFHLDCKASNYDLSSKAMLSWFSV